MLHMGDTDHSGQVSLDSEFEALGELLQGSE
jgi:hypothetical protein